jgi:hypothetical protein
MNPPETLTLLLAVGAGCYLLLSAVGVLTQSRAAEEFVHGLRTNRVLAHLTGAVAFFVGGLILLTNPGFGDWIPGLLSLTALWWMVEGALMLAAPGIAVGRSDAGRHFRRMNMLALPVGMALAIGALLQLA